MSKTEIKKQNLSLIERLRSLWNLFWFHFRKLARFRRSGYTEKGDSTTRFPPEAQDLNDRYQFQSVGVQLFPRHWIRNLATLWFLEKTLDEISFSDQISVLEPGSQDFARLPAFHAYFRKRGVRAQVTGVEVDPFVPLQGLHSRWDKAQYYMSLSSVDEAPAFLWPEIFFVLFSLLI